ncbi:sulfurtransferase-like selenium metabolism protein YedF [Anaerococcus sp. mt242]|uniref:sulfurtransferase-like selenium metabolism protein YedF n=1 Tax=Anaerococcus sp. mt242 TaxID=2661917 RepID=UPI0019326626|nr:sulfurtransferase-like selenium metabolism protein YedF [Anaerococcus sp. mt242]MBM0046122.1 sulfurtransferase-like selenium metabolism protein YedF [Anaerococcus sp. mt242]
MIQIDVLGKACPIPVIETKKALRENPDEKTFEILVDNEVATENLAKMAHELKIDYTVGKLADRKYEVSLEKTEASREHSVIEDYSVNQATSDNYIVIVNSDKIGDGDEEFSKQLLEGFIYSVTEQDHLPVEIIFYNRGVFLTTENEKTIEDLKNLENRGVRVYSCGLCLDHYGKKDKLAVGEITNMYKIVEAMRSNNAIYPC